MTSTFITGAEEGTGYETARQLINLGHRVLIGAHNTTRGEDAAQDLGAQVTHQGAQAVAEGVEVLGAMTTVIPHDPIDTFCSRARGLPW